MGEFSQGPTWLPRFARSNCCQGRLHQGKFNNPIVLSSMNIVLQLSELRLSTSPITRKGGLLPYVVYTGVYRWTGYGFWSLTLNMVYNFTRVFPNRAWSARSTFHFVFLSQIGSGCQTCSVTQHPNIGHKTPFSPRAPNPPPRLGAGGHESSATLQNLD